MQANRFAFVTLGLLLIDAKVMQASLEAVSPDLQTEFRAGTISPPGSGSSLNLSLRNSKETGKSGT